MFECGTLKCKNISICERVARSEEISTQDVKIEAICEKKNHIASIFTFSIGISSHLAVFSHLEAFPHLRVPHSRRLGKLAMHKWGKDRAGFVVNMESRIAILL